jgi:hypothetical protein
MHMVVSWDIKTENPKWAEIDAKLKDALQGFSWVRPLTTFYVVRLTSDADRMTIRDRMLVIAKAAGVTVHFILSPVMAGGRYDGYLPADSWPKLNERSDP